MSLKSQLKARHIRDELRYQLAIILANIVDQFPESSGTKAIVKKNYENIHAYVDEKVSGIIEYYQNEGLDDEQIEKCARLFAVPEFSKDDSQTE